MESQFSRLAREEVATFEQQNPLAGRGQGVGEGAASSSGSDDDDVVVVGHGSLLGMVGWLGPGSTVRRPPGQVIVQMG